MKFKKLLALILLPVLLLAGCGKTKIRPRRKFTGGNHTG